MLFLDKNYDRIVFKNLIEMQGPYDWSGVDAGLLRSLLTDAVGGSYNWSGIDAGLLRSLLSASNDLKITEKLLNEVVVTESVAP